MGLELHLNPSLWSVQASSTGTSHFPSLSGEGFLALDPVLPYPEKILIFGSSMCHTKKPWAQNSHFESRAPAQLWIQTPLPKLLPLPPAPAFGTPVDELGISSSTARFFRRHEVGSACASACLTRALSPSCRKKRKVSWLLNASSCLAERRQGPAGGGDRGTWSGGAGLQAHVSHQQRLPGSRPAVVRPGPSGQRRRQGCRQRRRGRGRGSLHLGPCNSDCHHLSLLAPIQRTRIFPVDRPGGEWCWNKQEEKGQEGAPGALGGAAFSPDLAWYL